MKIKSIAALCKKVKWVTVFQEYQNSDIQYIGDRTAFYQVDNLPRLNKESILTIFDIPEKKRGDWVVQVGEAPSYAGFSDAIEGEEIAEELSPEILYNEKILIPLQTQKGVVFLDKKYLSPLSDVMDVLNLFVRENKDGQIYIVAKTGLALKAVIFPQDITTMRFVEKIEQLAKECRCSLEQKNKIRNIKIDIETGEAL